MSTSRTASTAKSTGGRAIVRRDAVSASAGTTGEVAFAEVVSLIRAARQRAAHVVNTEVIALYWHIGQYLHHKIEADGWAKGTAVQLAAYVARR